MVSVSSIHMEENSGVVITNSSLRVLDYDTPENEIILTVIRKPSYGENAGREKWQRNAPRMTSPPKKNTIITASFCKII